MTDRFWPARCQTPTATAVAARAGFLEAEFGPEGPPIPAPWGPAGPIQEGGNVPALRARAHGAPTRLVAITWADEYQAVLARPEAGITDPADLAGRVVGVPAPPGRRIGLAGVTALRGFDRALRLAGLSLEDVHVRTFPDGTEESTPQGMPEHGRDSVRARTFPGGAEETVSPGMPGRGRGSARVRAFPDGAGGGPGIEEYRSAAAALAGGTVDAIWVRGAAGLAVRRALGAVEVAGLGGHPDPFVRINNGTLRTITVDAALLAAQPELVARYLAALLRAARWARTGGAEKIRALAAGTAGVRGPHTDFAPCLDGEGLAVLAAQSAFLELHGFINAPVDLGCWTDPRPLQRAWELAADPCPALPGR